MSALGDLLAGLSGAFGEMGLRWFLFGAQAVAIRGAPRATQDVDVTVEVPRSSLGDLIGALARRGFSHRFPEIADEIMRDGAVLPLTHAGSGLDLDLVLAGSGLESVALARAEPILIAGVLVPVIAPTDLVVFKVLAGRGRDLEDVRAVLAVGGVDVDEARDLLRQLEEALGQSDLLPALEAALRDVGPAPGVG
ncbi:MAG: hypothetical protein ABIO70_31815 [Pseudomonadota bacterium]